MDFSNYVGEREITRFLACVGPGIISTLEVILSALGYEIKRSGKGINTTLHINAPGKDEVNFFLYNLFLDIASIDRDEKPLRFDEKLKDFEYYTTKASRIMAGRVALLERILSAEGILKTQEDILNDPELMKHFSRVRVTRFERNRNDSERT